MTFLLRTLRSRTLSFGLLGAGGTFAFLLAVFGALSPRPVVERISLLAPFLLLYGLFFANTLLCTLDEWKVLRARRSVPLRDRLGRLSGIAFHLSFFLLLAGALLSRRGRFEGHALLAEGQEFRGSRAEYGEVEGGGAPPPLAFAVDRIEAEFWRERLLFTRLEARLHAIESPEAQRSVSLSRPLDDGGARVSLVDFSYGPEFELRDGTGRVVDRGMASLRVFPAGARDSFSLPGLPYEIHVRLYPDFVAGRDGPSSASSNLRNPVFQVYVLLGKVLVWSGLVPPGAPIPLGGETLVFPRLRRWGIFRVVVDPGRVWIALGLLAGTLSLALGLLRGERGA